ncbi:helix-turn-helix domain-containing protein [Silicimonas sp. MF1-12-2]|uniref:helix-turn-helix domain-containing protein n=1 Tax=Silicimonas sp. MF1-12-2 TaxID=3384793 RepID=UPI0039B56FD3
MTTKATGAQLRAARNALDWSIEELAEKSGVSVRTIIRYEQHDEVPPTRGGNLYSLIAALEAAGIEFIGSPEDGPGIRIHSASTKS